ncbi:MAG: di-heme oxidoredictase family protein [Polyangiaceae bacterium]
MLPPHDESLRERWARGSVVFDSLGCASCHRKELVLTLGMNWEEKPDLSDKVVAVDLVKDGDPPKTGRNVRLFSDLKRHDMGAELADRHPSSDGVPVREWLTRPLWGLAESPPYMHDGRAATIPAAILAHGGEGEAAKLAFERASDSDRKDLHVYLLSLSREPHLRVIR